MNQQDYLARHKELTEKMQEITRAKNTDYAGTENPFKNFELCEKLGVCTAEQGFLVRMSDKLQRMANLISRPNEVKDETIADTALDLANYCLLFLIYREANRPK